MAVTFGSVLRPEHVFVDVPTGSRDEVLLEILRRMTRTGSLTDGDARTILGAVLLRERLGATSVGRGIALPHCRTEAVSDPLVAFARMRTPIAFSAVDGDAVLSIFLVVSPLAAGDAHIEILRSVARIARDEYASRVLRNTATVDALHEFLREGEGR